MIHRKIVLLLLALICFSTSVYGQDQDQAATDIQGSLQEEVQDEAESEYLDDLMRDNPRGTMTGFMQAIDEGDTERAGEYLDTRNLPADLRQYEPEQLALGLSIVLERATWIDLISYSELPEGEENDGLPSYRDELAVVDLNGEELQLYLQRVPGSEGLFIWKVSNASLARLLDLFEQYRYSPYVEWLFTNLPSFEVLGLELFKFVSAMSVGLLVLPVCLLVSLGITRLLLKPTQPMYRRLNWYLMAPVTTCIILLSMTAVINNLGIGLATDRQILGGQFITIIIVLWLLLSTIDLAKYRYAAFLRKQDKESSIALLNPLTTSVKIIMILVGGLQWMDNLGYEITALLAGLGVGGIAVALVLQKPLEDIFGAITLYTQQPIKPGDFGRFGNVTGTVEEISLRTTRIRTLANTLIAVPNMVMAEAPIENYSARQKILYNPIIRLKHDISQKQLNEVLEGLRKLLLDSEMVIDEKARVRFVDIGEEAHEVQIFAYVNRTEYPSYLEAAEELNFGVLDVLEKVGVELALPMPDVIRN